MPKEKMAKGLLERQIFYQSCFALRYSTVTAILLLARKLHY
jgi:hypothetical protein